MYLKGFIKNINKDINKEQETVLKDRSLRVLFSEVFTLLVSAFVLSASFPGFLSRDGIGFLVFVALIPLFGVIHNTTFKTVWFYGFLYGYAYYMIFNYWLSAFHPLANVLVQVIKGTEMTGLFLCLKLADAHAKEKFASLFQALIWVSYTYLSQNWFAGYPYGTAAYALFKYRILIQIASFSGIWLLNFIIVLPQAFIGNYLCDRVSSTRGKFSLGLGNHMRRHIVLAVCYAVIVLFQIMFGIAHISYVNKKIPKRVYSVITVQHNADSWKGGYATYEKNFTTLKNLSNEALEKNPDADMIVWSETAFVPSVNWYTNYKYAGDDKGSQFDYLRKIQVLVDDFVSFGKGLGIPLVTGNPFSVLSEGASSPYDEEGYWNKDDYNSVILFDEGTLKDMYLKQHLVPFTEHFPYEKQLPLLYKILLANDYNWWLEGKESKVMHTSNGLNFSSPICFEDVFGSLNAEFAENGADVLINLTNDSWSGSEDAERQHGYMAVFRAVETGLPVLRSTNSGLTCLILPDGRIAGEMEPFTEGYRSWDVPVYERGKDTLYVRYKDLIAKMCTCATSFILLYLLSRAAYCRLTEKRRVNGEYIPKRKNKKSC